MRVATFNIWGRWADWPQRLAALVDAWPDPPPDVVMLQEVRHDAVGDQAQEIADALGYPTVVMVEGHRNDDGAEGLAMLARVALREVGERELPVSEPARRALEATVDIDGRPVRLVCAHTVATPERDRARQVQALLDHPADPLILGADLNDVPSAVASLLAEAGLDDCLGQDERPTWPMCEVTFGEAWRAQIGRVPHFSLEPRRLDYLLTRGVQVAASGVEPLQRNGRHASDHAMIWADVVAGPQGG